MELKNSPFRQNVLRYPELYLHPGMPLSQAALHPARVLAGSPLLSWFNGQSRRRLGLGLFPALLLELKGPFPANVLVPVRLGR
jgi:hypothetical protein